MTGERTDEAQCECTVERCDIFDFMALHVGLTVIHPGGLKATRALADSCHLDERARVADIACGKGTSAIYLAENYGCKVVGIDISPDLIAQATRLAAKRRVKGLVDFLVGDALDLPFSDGEFDCAVSQAMLVLVADKRQAIREALRVTKPGGHLGWLELSWTRSPTAEFLAAVSDVLCARCMRNVGTFQQWEELLSEVGVRDVRVLAHPLGRVGMFSMLADEGLINTTRALFKHLTDARIRRRMNTMDRFFKSHAQQFGYGIYTGTK